MPADTGTAPAADHAVPAPSAQDVAGDALPVPAELSEGAGMPAPGGFAPVPAHAGKTLPAGVLPAGNTIGDAATLPGAVSAPAGAGLPQPECRRDQSGTAQSAVSVPSFRKILRVAVVAVLVVAVLVVAVVALVVNFEHAREVAGRNGEDWRQWL